MIIQALLELLFKIFSLLTSVINIPSMPNEVYSALNDCLEFVSSGIRILSNFLPMQYFAVLFGIVIAVDFGVSFYHFVMWILKKIPVAGIK